MHEAEWVALGVAATLFTALVAQRLGLVEISLMRKAHELSVALAKPRIGTDIRIDGRNVEGRDYPPFYFLIISIYNEGDLPAQEIIGYCRLWSPTNQIAEKRVHIGREFLGNSKYELEHLPLGSNQFDRVMRGENPQFRFNVDIEFDYSGMPENQPQHYSAKYEFDPQNPRVLKKL